MAENPSAFGGRNRRAGSACGGDRDIGTARDGPERRPDPDGIGDETITFSTGQCGRPSNRVRCCRGFWSATWTGEIILWSLASTKPWSAGGFSIDMSVVISSSAGVKTFLLLPDQMEPLRNLSELGPAFRPGEFLWENLPKCMIYSAIHGAE